MKLETHGWEVNMYKDNNDMYEVHDFDEDIQYRQRLIEEAKKIQVDEDLNKAIFEATTLKKKWKRIPYWESVFEDTLAEEFDQTVDKIFSIRKEAFDVNKRLKEEAIAKAHALTKCADWNKASVQMNALMDEWKAIGSTGKESDEVLWEAFRNERQVFFDGKRQYWEDAQKKFKKAYEVKQGLIAQAAQYVDSKDWNKTNDIYKSLMDQWIAAGSAGKVYENELWTAFQGHRQKFYEQRNEHYKSLHVEQAQRYEKKKELVMKAQSILDAKRYVKEDTQQMKALGEEWKHIGSCGKDKENQIWDKFRGIMDLYFLSLKEASEKRQREWRQRMIDLRSKKQEIIANQKRQITYMKNDMVGLLGQRSIDDMQEEIDEKHLFIKELEEQIQDLDKKINE